MVNNFKKGDRVIVVPYKNNNTSLIIGEEYIVEKYTLNYDTKHPHPHRVQLEGKIGAFFEERFIKVVPKIHEIW